MSTVNRIKTLVTGRMTSRRSEQFRKQLIAYLFLLPALLAFSLVSWYPIARTVVSSFQQVGLRGLEVAGGLGQSLGDEVPPVGGRPADVVLEAHAPDDHLGVGVVAVALGPGVDDVAVVLDGGLGAHAPNEAYGRWNGRLRGFGTGANLPRSTTLLPPDSVEVRSVVRCA